MQHAAEPIEHMRFVVNKDYILHVIHYVLTVSGRPCPVKADKP